MLWSALWKKLGKQPLRITQHNHITAIIDGKEVALDLKFKKNGVPYFEEAQEPQPKEPEPEFQVCYWLASCEVQDVMDGPGESGETYVRTVWTKTCGSKEEAMEALERMNGNTVRRIVWYPRIPDGFYETHIFDFQDKCWRRDSDGKKIPE